MPGAPDAGCIFVNVGAGCFFGMRLFVTLLNNGCEAGAELVEDVGDGVVLRVWVGAVATAPDVGDAVVCCCATAGVGATILTLASFDAPPVLTTRMRSRSLSAPGMTVTRICEGLST